MKTTIAIAFFVLSAMGCKLQHQIQIAELPGPSPEFLDTHFSGIAIEKAKKDAEHGEKGYEVRLADGTEVEFWKDGNYREVDGRGKPIPTAFIDPKITAWVSKNYPDRKITHIDYGHKDVDVDLTGNKDLEFAKDGSFLKD